MGALEVAQGGPENIDARVDHASRKRTRLLTFGLVFAAYLALSVVMWWNVWSTHPTTATTCGCGDTSLFLWFLEWPAYALTHGHSLFYSTALFHPGGINLLANTSVLAIGVPLAPITWLFGPIATLNVASTLTPALSAVSMFWLLRRWVRWMPAAFFGGLVFGFSPFAFENIAGSHLMLGFLALIPLVIACLDELLIRQHRRPVVPGIALGLLVAVQFFVSTEVLAMVVLMGAAGVTLLVAYAAIGHRHEIATRSPHALRGLGTAVAVSVALLAYPVWFALRGPAHLSGLVWPTIEPGSGGISLGDIWSLHFMTSLENWMRATGGYQGPALPQPEFVGLGILLVLAAGGVIWRRDRRLWFFAALGAVAVILSLGLQSYWTPWRLLTGVPLLQNVIPGRFAAITSLCVAAMFGVVLDRVHGAVKSGAWQAVAAPATIGVAALAAGSMATAIVGNVPLTTAAVAVPRWFSDVAPHLPPGQVVLVIPAPFTLDQSAEGWQALDSMRFALVGGSGPGSVLSRAGRERAGQKVISTASFSFDGPPPPTAANISAVRSALADWGVTDVVIPDPASVPRYERVTSPAGAIGLLTVAVGRQPRYTDGSWVWGNVGVLGPPRSISPAAFARCTLRPPTRTAPLRVPDCVIAASQRTP